MLLLPVLLGVTLLSYGLLYLSPNDPAEMMLIAQGIPLEDVLEELGRRSEKIGNLKPMKQVDRDS